MWAEKRATTVPLPYIVAPSGEFDGIDGNWSTFSLEVGQPTQKFRVFISTAGVVSWLPGVRNATTSPCPFRAESIKSPRDCQSLRGIESTVDGGQTGYNVTVSTTAQRAGLGNLILSSDMSMQSYYGSNYNLNISYALDTLAVLPLNEGKDLSQTSVPIALVPDSVDLFLGSLGLGFGGIELQNQIDLSFMQQVANASNIPSRSWGYTAGASYLQNGYTGSLILGGYDQNRFKPTSTTFQMPATREETLLRVQVTSITADGKDGSDSWSATAQSGGTSTEFPAVLDSTLPFIYLPENVLSVFVNRLGLRYDKATDLYTMNSSQATKNRQNVDTLSFTITDPDNADTATTITLPYAAFDLNATNPLYNGSVPYFPVRKALSSDTNVLGRTFFQGAYVVADYERRNFTVAPALFPPRPVAEVVPIYNTSYRAPTEHKKSSSGSSISGGAIAGIVIGVLAAVGILVALYWIFFIRKKKQREQIFKEAEIGPYTDTDDKEGQSGRRNTVDTIGTYDSEQTATVSELAAFPAGRPPHSRNLSELSSESDMSRQKRGRTMSPPPIFELEDVSDATQWAANERRMQDRMSNSPNGRLTPAPQEEDHPALTPETGPTSPQEETTIEHSEHTSSALEEHPSPLPDQHGSPIAEDIVSPTSASVASPNPILSPLSDSGHEDALHNSPNPNHSA